MGVVRVRAGIIACHNCPVSQPTMHRRIKDDQPWLATTSCDRGVISFSSQKRSVASPDRSGTDRRTISLQLMTRISPWPMTRCNSSRNQQCGVMSSH